MTAPFYQQPDSAALHQQPQPQGPIKTEEPLEQVPHTYEALQELPANATAVQQDSALQAVFQSRKARQPARPDTLQYLTQGSKIKVGKVNLPQYYKETFFSKDSLLHPEISGGRYGVAGDPVPYSIKGDDMITGLLLGCIVLALVAFARSRRFIVRQAKNFFRIESRGTTEITETTGEFRFQFFLVLQTCLLFSLIAYFYTHESISDAFVFTSQYQLIALFFGIFAAYYIVKAMLSAFVNWVFFDKRGNEQWLKAQLFLTSMLGEALFPMVMLQSYFGLTVQNAAYYIVFVIGLVKILSFYKTYLIFFRCRAFNSQIILYFCTLEIMPLLLLCGGLAMTIDYLRINI